MAKVFRYILFGIIMLLLILPYIQKEFKLFNPKPLKGSFELAEKPNLSTEGIFNEEYQNELNNYIEDHIGFRPLLVRLNNQIAFTLFDTAVANWVLVGKNNYLYETNYIRGYLGRDFLGKDSLNDITALIKCIQDTLDKYGVKLVLAFAPGKASYYPEYIPEKFNPDIKTLSNYKYYIQRCNELGINCIDFNDWFVNMKDTVGYPLVPKCGIHWSTYGVNIALDSLMKYFEHLKKENFYNISWDSSMITEDYEDTDYDVAEGMNLLFRIDQGPMAYPYSHVVPDSGARKADVVFIADSFYWNIFGLPLSRKLFHNHSFWYYYKQVINPKYKGNKKMSELDLAGELINKDFIVVLASETNLYRYGFGFFEAAAALFNCENEKVKE